MNSVMLPKKIILLFLCLSAFAQGLFAQATATVYGTIIDKEKNPIEFVSVSVVGLPGATQTDAKGKYSLEVPAGKKIKVAFSHISFQTQFIEITPTASEQIELKPSLSGSAINITEIQIEDKATRQSTLKRLDPKLVEALPTSGGIEALLKTFPGVSSNNELSSQYNVRGGNFDENLIYVNDIEVYRPFLVRSGGQEGLSFVNPDMVSGVLFSAGGYDARYGDKMSSVLDVTYRKPKEFAANVSASLLGASITLEGTNKSKRLSAIVGVRERSNSYLLKSLDTKGDYRPRFIDGQMYLTYQFTTEFEMGLLGNYAQNKYRFIPTDRETDFGTVNTALRLKVYFDGKEVNNFDTYLGALSFIYKPQKDVTLKLISSAFRSYESEKFDVLGQYFIGQLETDFGKDNFGDATSLGNVGSYLTHGRNLLDATVFNVEHKGYKKELQWGIKYQSEFIKDQISEWKLQDSAGFSIPQSKPDVLELQNVVKSKNTLSSSRITDYIQNTWHFGDTTEFSFTAGVRSHYWDVNKQFLISPRATISMIPNWKRDFLFRFSAGYYYQPPFYRELRDLNGVINTNLKAQTSIHFVLASDYNFKMWDRPFKFVAEGYYKYLDNLVPYEIDNVRIRYYANNNAKGYATGIDLKLNGEFVKGLESWVSVSVMQTQEDIKDDFYYDYYNKKGNKIVKGYTFDQVATDSVLHTPGYIPRPTDQRVNFALFFQDFIPRFPSWKVHLNLLYGSGFPFGPPSYERYKDTLRIPPYRRVDIGFSKQLLSETKVLPAKNPFHFFKSIWASAEVFNLLQISNTISYLWVTDVTARQYAIPNYLTRRQLNIKLIFKF
ncbi:MAG: TonB-dependent receptor [Bacteroidetes bacterium]|nr:TonB-dependent receptor [Bacteroidota bacterium]